MKRRFFSMLPTILFLGLLAALVTVRSVTSAQSIHSMAIEPGYLAQYSTVQTAKTGTPWLARILCRRPTVMSSIFGCISNRAALKGWI